MPDRRLTLLLGGARSGKSCYAENLVKRYGAPWIYVATAQAMDQEMNERIAEHRSRRDQNWRTVDAPLDLTATLAGFAEGAPVLIDCLTLWLSNTMLAERDLDAETARLVDVMSKPRGPWFAVSNEVGMGIIPDTPLGRRFRDAQGRLNAQIAAVADKVIFMVAGLPMKVK